MDEATGVFTYMLGCAKDSGYGTQLPMAHDYPWYTITHAMAYFSHPVHRIEQNLK